MFIIFTKRHIIKFSLGEYHPICPYSTLVYHFAKLAGWLLNGAHFDSSLIDDSTTLLSGVSLNENTTTNNTVSRWLALKEFFTFAFHAYFSQCQTSKYCVLRFSLEISKKTCNTLEEATQGPKGKKALSFSPAGKDGENYQTTINSKCTFRLSKAKMEYHYLAN